MIERQLFEREMVFLSPHPIAFDVNEDGSYKNTWLNLCWRLWRIARTKI